MGRKGPKPKTYNHFQVTLDKFLGSKNLWRKAIAKDGSCLFRAVAEQVLLSQAYHHQVRLQCADYISRHRDDFKEFLTVKVEEYLDRLRDGQLWGGEVELVVFSKMYRRSIVVFNQQVNQVQEQIFYSPEDEAAGRRPEDLLNPIFLAYSDGNHYDSVYLKKHRSNMAFCQSVVYSLLYEKVFEETLSQSSKQRLKTLYDSEIQKLAAEDKGDKHLTFLSKTYPIGVLEGMGQNCFSNTPLHVYQRERDCIEQQDRNVAAAIQFQVGDKCLVPVPGEQSCYYNGEIATPVKPNGCHMVYIFEVGEQWEIPCKDITVPGPSPSATPVRRTTGPSHAWSKAHQRIQPGLPRGKAIPEDTPTSLSSSPPEQLVTDISPPDLQHTHHNHLPSHIITNTRTTPTMTSSLTTTDTSTNMGPKMNQSTKPHNKSVPVPSGSVPVASTSRLPSGKMGGADVGVVLQHGVRSDDQQSRRSGVGGGGKVRSNGGSGILGSAPHGFLVASRDKPLPKTQKVAGESDKPANLPGRTIISEPPQPPNIDQPSQPVVVPPSVVTMPSHPASYPTLYIKTAPSVPRGSLSTSDESSTSSNEECGNGHPSGHIPVNPSQTTANTATGPIPLFFSHPIGRYVLPMLPEGRPSVHIPPAPPVNPHSAAQVASVLERPLMHAPMPQSQPPLVQQPTPIVKSHLHQHQVIQTVRPPPGSSATTMVVSTPSPQHKIPPQGNQGNEIGRESPYMDSQLLQRKSSQPEEAWPMVGEEDREKDQPPSTSSPPAHIHPRFMFPFNMANAPPHDQQGIPIMQPPHMATHPVMPPGGPTPPGVPVSMPHIVPFILTHQPFPQPHHLQHQHMIEVDTDTKEVQTSPYPSPQPLMKDKEIDVRPLTFSMSTQCTGVNRKEAESNTVLVEGINIPLYVPNDIKPPNVSIDNMDMDAQICLVTQYAMQCLKLYEVADRDGAKSALNIVQSLSESVHNEIQEREKSLREEIKEEVREEVRMELIEEVREEMKTTMRDEIMNEVRSEFGEVLSHKPLNMDEQNFLQLFTNSQQGLRETIHDGRMVLPEEHGRYGGSPIPPNLQNIGFVDKLHHQLIGSQGDTDDVIQPSGNHDNDPAGVQEVSVPPFHQMPPNPMMVPPGARPMVVTMPGMPWYPYMPFPMFMPPHHQMNVLPPPVLPPHMTPDQTNDDLEEHQPDQTEGQEDHLPTGDNHHTILESTTTTTGDIELLEGEQEVMVTEGETDDILPQNNLTSTVPASDTLDTHPVNLSPTHQLTAFPSADLHTGLDDIELPSTIAGSDLTTTNSPPPPQPSLSLSLSSSSSSKHTVELVTPQVSPYTHSLDDISPTPQPTSTGHHGDDELNNTHWDDGTSNDRDVLSSNSHTIRPGLPCRRRDINDIDRVLGSADDGREVEEELKEDETTTSHVIQRQPSNKGKARHGNIHRGNKSRDGTYHGGGGDGTGRAGKAHNKASDRRHTLSNQQSSSSTATEPSSKTSVTSGGHQSTRSHTHTPTSSTSPDLQTASSHSQSKTGQSRVHTTTAGGKSRTQTTASSNGTTSSSSTVRNSSGEGVKKNAPDTKLSGEVVKVTTGKDSSSGGSSVKGGSGASVRGGGKAGNKGRGPGVVGGRDRKNDTSNSVGGDDGRQAASVATSVAASKIEEKDLASDEVSSEGKKNLRQNYSRSGSNQKYGRQKDSRKPIGSVQVGGGGGGRGGHWTHRQPHTTGDNDTRHKLRVNTTASKTVREQGDSKSKAKRVNSVPDSGTTQQQQQQQSTRCSRQSCLKTLSDTQQQLLPSFKNLYSSNQDDEIENELLIHSSQESWPSMTQHCDDLTPLPSQYLPSSPASLSLTGVCHQSSPHLPKHFSGPNSSSNLPSYHHNTSDIQKDLLTFFPALLSTVTTDAEQAT